MTNPIYRRRLWQHRIGIGLSILAMAFGIGALAWILVTLLIKGGSAVNLAMFTQNTPGPGTEGGGLLNAILGSVMIVAVGSLISTPIGILAGIYLAEYGETSKFAQLTRFVTDVMLSAPSIVIGLFVWTAYVANVGHFSGWAGSIAISLIAIPVIVRTTDNMLNLVPTNLREAAYALGAPRWKVALMVRLRAVKAGVMTGILLAIARISGETAPLMFTALGNGQFSTNMNGPMANLPLVIRDFAMSAADNWIRLGWGAALLITFSVLAINILSRLLSSQKVQS